ncbi:tetratricopeptide repeat protein [Campylobacter gastrosuis]|uniref:beta-lactamase n=1 Tax=Campylobacter gastrosuis TaxID=2974576 RepID=A0ABT7HR33_9BACT|nr:tetratricopeptide repeat protein [Campylobacter gastrosuis]MDL0089323.1 sel1 repeat family protein [Campylobacter gastrosuis]
MKNIKFSKVILGLAVTSAFVFANGDLKTLEKECENGVVKSCNLAGGQYYNGSFEAKQDYEKALKYFTKACEAKEDSEDKFSSCFQLGNMYFFDQGVEKNPKKAVELYKKACDGKEGYGCDGLAVAYYNGIGVKKDEVKATAMFRNYCDENNRVFSCNMFATIIENSDKQKALIYYKKACDIGKNDIKQLIVGKEVWQDSCNKYEILK